MRCSIAALVLLSRPSPAAAQQMQAVRRPGSMACPDFDGSGGVAVGDLLLMLGAFGAQARPDTEAFDLNSSGLIDVADLLLLLGAFGQTCAVSPGVTLPGSADQLGPGANDPVGSHFLPGMDALFGDGAGLDACSCLPGMGWSSSAGACTADAHTSAAEAAACAPGSGLPPPTAEEACARLQSDKGLDCGACLAVMPRSRDSCPEWSAADDRAAERGALFPRGVRSLYNSTDWLWAEAEAPIRRVELDIDDEDWAYLMEDPTREEYRPATLKLYEAQGGGDVQPQTSDPRGGGAGGQTGSDLLLGVWPMVGFRFKGSVGSLGRCRGRGGGNCNKMSMKVRLKGEKMDH